MILIGAILIMGFVLLFIITNRQAPRSGEIAMFVIVYAVTLIGFYLSDIGKRKIIDYPVEKSGSFSCYIAYSKTKQYFVEIPLMKYFAIVGSPVIAESLPAFVLRNSNSADHQLNDETPFEHPKYPYFLRDYMELRVIDALVDASRYYQIIEPHASSMRFAVNVSADRDIMKVIDSPNRISFEMLSNELRDNQLYRSFLEDNALTPAVKAKWQKGISLPENLGTYMSIDHPQDNETRIKIKLYSNFPPLLSQSFMVDVLTINIRTNKNLVSPWMGEWIAAYDDPQNTGTPMDYLMTEADLSVKTQFSSFTLWNAEHIVSQKWLNYLYDTLKFQLDFAEDYKYIDRRMIQSILNSTKVIRNRLDKIEKKLNE